MRAEHINPFIASLVNAFETMLSCEVRRGQLRLKSQGPAALYDISGVIGLSGKAVGTVVVSLSKEVALKATSIMLMCEAIDINEDVVDAVGELTNMIAGAAKAKLEEYELSISLPSVVTGQDHLLRFSSEVTPICVPFETDWGPLVLEVGLEVVPEPAAV